MYNIVFSNFFFNLVFYAIIILEVIFYAIARF
jgi:hypothetical protein